MSAFHICPKTHIVLFEVGVWKTVSATRAPAAMFALRVKSGPQAAIHSITASARSKNNSAIVNPSALALLICYRERPCRRDDVGRSEELSF